MTTLTVEMIQELAKSLPRPVTLYSLTLWSNNVTKFEHGGEVFVIANPATWLAAFDKLACGYSTRSDDALASAYMGRQIINLDTNDAERKRVMLALAEVLQGSSNG
jgi:hypothetical protein